MNKILQQIANTIVANLANTESIGLFDGKLGIALFLCRYSRYSGCSIYEDIASDLIDDVFKQLKPNMSPSAIDGMASIGYGLSILLKERFLESDPDDDVLQDIDNALLTNVKVPFMQELHFPVPLYSSGLYLLSRLPHSDKEIEQKWIDQVVENAIGYITQGVKKGQSVPKLSLLNSMLFVFKRLMDTGTTDKRNIVQLLGDLLELSAQAIQNSNKELDVLLLKQSITTLPTNLKQEKQDVIKAIEQIDVPLNCDPKDFWYDNLWWSILYDVPVVEGFSFDTIIDYIDNRIQDSYYDEMIVNNKLSAVGLWMMSKKRFSHIY